MSNCYWTWHYFAKCSCSPFHLFYKVLNPWLWKMNFLQNGTNQCVCGYFFFLFHPVTVLLNYVVFCFVIRFCCKTSEYIVEREIECGFFSLQQIPVPRSLIGVIIGKGGDMIKKIQEQSGSRIQFKPEDEDVGGPTRICTISGPAQGNQTARGMIMELIEAGMVSWCTCFIWFFLFIVTLFLNFF